MSCYNISIHIYIYAYRDDCISVTKCDPASCRMNEHYEGTATDHGFVLHWSIMLQGSWDTCSESCRSNLRRLRRLRPNVWLVTSPTSWWGIKLLARGRHGQTLSLSLGWETSRLFFRSIYILHIWWNERPFASTSYVISVDHQMTRF